MQEHNKRIFTVYTADITDAGYRKQMQILNADQAGLTERDIEVKTCVYSAKTAGTFKNKNLKPAFAVTLTGKDGGEKYRASKPILLQTLFGIIDAMPMRINEMRKNKP